MKTIKEELVLPEWVKILEEIHEKVKVEVKKEMLKNLLREIKTKDL